MADVWLKRDIANALNAADQNIQQIVNVLDVNHEQARIFIAGYNAAVITIALFFGLQPNIMRKEIIHRIEPFEL